MPGPELLRPTTLAEASQMLLAHGDDALALAGGTALILLLRQRLIAPRYFVDVTGLPGLRDIRADGHGGWDLGALVTLREVERAAGLRSTLPLLSEAYATVGNVRIRHVATVGGNLAHGDHRLDPPAALLALDARLTIASEGGQRDLPVSRFFRGFEETALARGELITGVTIPAPPPGAAGAYVKLSALAADDWPCVGAAALVALDGDGRVAALRVAVIAAHPVPLLIDDAMPLAVGRTVSTELIDEVGALAAARVTPIADIRGSAWYKREVTSVAVRDALARALERARAHPVAGEIAHEP
jgi:aerobic carbon-monoxide dehydrogenase medium subunit